MKLARWLALTLLAGALIGIAAPAQAAPPANDNISGATVVGTLPYVTSQDTSGATNDSYPPDLSCGTGNTVWFKYVAAQSGDIVAHTRGSSFDTVLTLYQPSTPGSINNIFWNQCSDDAARQRSELTFHATAGNTYYIQAGGFLGATGTLRLSVNRGGVLSGVVRNGATGSPLPGACVSLVSSSGKSHFASSSATGFYAIGGLPGGEYRQGQACQDGQPRPWTGPAYAAEGRTLSAPDLVVDRGGLRGALTDQQTGQPIGDVCVTALDEAGDQVAGTFASTTGYYELVTRPGTFNVHFEDCSFPQKFAPEYFNGAVDLAGATPVTVANGVTTYNVDASLMRSGIVSGLVLDQNTNQPVRGACVRVERASDGALLASGSTGFGRFSTGFYRVGGFPAQPVVVKGGPCSSATPYAPEWYSNSTTRSGAQVLNLAAGVTAAANFTLGAGSRISGVVRNGGGAALANECVLARSADGIEYQTTTSPTGLYSFPNIEGGQFKVRFAGCGTATAREWYQDQQSEAAANVITLSGGSFATANAILGPGATVNGRVADLATGKVAKEGIGVAAVCVDATDAAGALAATAYPSVTGLLQFVGLPSGHFTMRAYGCFGSTLEPREVGGFDAVAGSTSNFGSRDLGATDSDGDGVRNSLDNCPLTANADQADTNNDDLGNACDLATPTVPPACVVSGAQVVCTYSTFGEHSFVVPAGVTVVDVIAVGGKGGDFVDTGSVKQAGGRGAYVKGRIDVSPGTTLYAEVGESGQSNFGTPASGGGGNGGGDGTTSGNAGGGGGASDLRTLPGSDPNSLNSRVLVAGGGGGAGGLSGSGGVGGNAGARGSDGANAPGTGGRAGTATAGGAAGAYGGGGHTPSPGTLGVGGRGSYCAGGGGGGFYGGGGGGAVRDSCSAASAGNQGGGGGGGGSSLVPTGGTVALAGIGAQPRVVISYTTSSSTAPKFTVADRAIVEGHVLKTIQVHVKLSKPAGHAVSVVVKTSNGTAIAGSDYVAVNTDITFGPDTTDVIVPIKIKGERLKEGNETFFVNLSSPTGGATIARAKATITLTNDD